MTTTTQAPRAPRIKQKAGPFRVGADYVIARQVMAARRRAGDPFDTAWETALYMTAPDDRAALELTRVAWENAYHRKPFHTGGAFGKLTAVTVVDDTDSAERGDRAIA